MCKNIKGNFLTFIFVSMFILIIAVSNCLAQNNQQDIPSQAAQYFLGSGDKFNDQLLINVNIYGNIAKFPGFRPLTQMSACISGITPREFRARFFFEYSTAENI